MAKIALIVGSLRKNSLNKALLDAAIELAPAGTDFVWTDIGQLPLFNDDLDNNAARPAAVANFRQTIREADGVLIASPEYNYSISGVLKNALDWGSRPYAQGVWVGRPMAIIGASPGFMGTARATQGARQIATDLGARVFNQGEVLVANAFNAIEEGKLTDENTRKILAAYLERYVNFIEASKA